MSWGLNVLGHWRNRFQGDRVQIGSGVPGGLGDVHLQLLVDLGAAQGAVVLGIVPSRPVLLIMCVRVSSCARKGGDDV